MKCDSCDNKATVFYTQVTEGKLKKFTLCESCAHQKGITDPNSLLMAGEAFKPSSGSGESSDFVSSDRSNSGYCDTCGFTLGDLQKVGRLGCPDCYGAFAPEIGRRLSSMHKGESHVGHVPSGLVHQIELDESFKKKELELEKAIFDERYEEAAKLRDELERLKAEREVGK